jgi:hypothetical protein
VAFIATFLVCSLNINGANRTYWDFFFGFWLFVTVLMLFAPIVAWQLGRSYACQRLGVRGLLCRNNPAKRVERPGTLRADAKTNDQLKSEVDH